MSDNAIVARTRWKVTAAALLLIIGAFHAAAAPDQAHTAAYLGLLFGLNAAVAVALSAGVLIRPRTTWPLAAAYAAITLELYLAARTAGLPADHDTDWTDLPFGLPSVALESMVVILYFGLSIWDGIRRDRQVAALHSRQRSHSAAR